MNASAGDDVPWGTVISLPDAPGQVVAQVRAALLPRALPVLPGVRTAVHCRAAGGEPAGGDWFDVIARPDGSVVLACGEVAGQGLPVIAAMGQLRAVVNEFVSAGSDLGAVLARADAMARRVADLYASTLVLAVLDPDDRSLTYVTCGHAPPLIIAADGGIRHVPGSRASPLGTGTPSALLAVRLDPGDVVLLVSDGLVERPGQSIASGLEELTSAAGAAVAGVRADPTGPIATERICEHVMDMLTRSGYDGDAVVLAAEMLAATVPAFELVMPAAVGSLRSARDQLDNWLVSAGAAAEDRDAIRLAAVELLTNAIEHAYPAGVTGPFRLRAVLSDQGELEVQVSDHGSWQEPDGTRPDRGNGLMVAGQLADRLQVDAAPDGGTTVTLRRQLSRPPVFSAAPAGPGSASAADGQDLSIEVRWDGSEPVALVRGPVDAGTAQLLLRRLLAASRGGTLPLTVDLCLASHLASAGVRALFQLKTQLARHGRSLTLRAEGNAREVLRLAGLGLPCRQCQNCGRPCP
jgi:anti-sigma regulatory factor (Ser/Thr protein kinase)/anti-anti-sigma regulatory factor